ncbi:hypothetical protein ACFL56_02605, partial [Candidatus Margulisiibacteriota bacterium]
MKKLITLILILSISILVVSGCEDSDKVRMKIIEEIRNMDPSVLGTIEKYKTYFKEINAKVVNIDDIKTEKGKKMDYFIDPSEFKGDKKEYLKKNSASLYWGFF